MTKHRLKFAFLKLTALHGYRVPRYTVNLSVRCSQ